jgi:hypothetical protein
MGSTIRSSGPPIELQTSSASSVRWRSWPLVDDPIRSWLLPLGILIVGVFVFWLGGWFPALAAIAALAVVMWQFWLPVTFEVTTLGLRRYAIGRVRVVPWQAIRSYQLRPTGIAFFQRPHPTKMDMLKSLFVPYPHHDEDEMLVAVRLYLPHAVELPA